MVELLFGEATVASVEVHADPSGKCCFREANTVYCTERATYVSRVTPSCPGEQLVRG